MDGPFLTSQLEIPLKDTKCLKLQTNQISANLGNACVLRAKCEYQGKVESYRRPLFFHFCNQSNPYCYMKKNLIQWDQNTPNKEGFQSLKGSQISSNTIIAYFDTKLETQV